MPEADFQAGRKQTLEFEPLLDCIEAAGLMHMHPESLKRLARAGRITAAKIGGVWRFRASALDAYVQKITLETQVQIAESMAPSKSAFCGVRDWRK